MQLGCVIRRRSELLDDFSPYASSRLLHPYHGAVAGIALNEEFHLIISHQNVISANIS